MAHFDARRLPRCCGVLEVGGFFEGQYLKADLLDFIRKGPGDVGGKVGMLIATTNGQQRLAVQALREVGFVELAEFFNPKSENQVKLWGMVVNQPKAAPMPRNVVAKLPATKPKKKAARKKRTPVPA